MIEHLRRLIIGSLALAAVMAVFFAIMVPLVYLVIEYPGVFGALMVTAVCLLVAYGVGMVIRES